MSKNSSVTYYQKNKDRLHKKLVKGIKIFLRKRKTKSGNMVASQMKIFQKMKNKD